MNRLALLTVLLFPLSATAQKAANVSVTERPDAQLFIDITRATSPAQAHPSSASGSESAERSLGSADVSQFGARSVYPAFDTTGSIASGSQSLKLASPSNFRNGDGLTVLGGGATLTLKTPGNPTVTPSVAAGPTGGGNVARAPSGNASYSYEIVADDGKGGLTPASGAGSTSNGQVSLGLQSVSGCQLSRTNNVVTVSSCAAAESLAAQAVVFISGAGDNSFNGWFTVKAVSNSSTFVLMPSGEDTRAGGEGAGTSAMAGINWFNCNHLSWTAVPGAWKYHVYKSVRGVYQYLGDSQPTAVDGNYPVTYFDDFGPIMEARFVREWWVPPISRSSSQNDFLTTTITSGGGTTNVTLAAPASKSVSGATVEFDNGPALAAAARFASANSEGNIIYVPAGYWPVFSPITFPSNTTLVQQGQLYLGATIAFHGGSNKYFGMQTSNGNAGAQFNLNTDAPVSGTANPLIYVDVGNGFVMDGIGLSASGNGQIDLLLDSMGTFELTHNDFNTSIGGYDYLSSGLVIRNAWAVGGGTVRPRIDDNLFLGDTLPYGATSMGTLVVAGGGSLPIQLARNMFNGKGITFENGINWLSSTNLYSQSLEMPFIYDNGGASFSQPVHIDKTEIDTSIGPLFASLSPSGVLGGNLYVSGLTAAANSILVTGNGVANLMLDAPGATTIGQNSNTSGCSYALSAVPTSYFTPYLPGVSGFCSSALPILHSGLFSESWLLSPPTAVIATVTGGGSLQVGTWTFKVTATTPDGAETVASLTSPNVATTPGNQTVTITCTAPVNAAGLTDTNVTYNVYGSLNGAGYSGAYNLIGLTKCKAIANASNQFGYGNPPAIGTAGYPAIGPSGIYTPQVTTKSVTSVRTTVSALPSPANSAGVTMVVSDSTKISTEGQPCVGGSTNTALAFSNGIQWKCF